MKELPQTALLYQEAAKRILILDGAMGTMFRTQELSEKDFRKGPFADAKKDLFSVKDILNLTKPSAPAAIHDAYLAAGADIIETNTFNANAVALAEFGLARFAYDINKAGAQLARACANKFAAKDKRPRFVAGSMGPTGRTASLSPDPDDPAARNITFDELREAYYFASLGLLDGGADLVLIETVFDTLNAKAAVMGVAQAAKARGVSVPVMLSGTVSDINGKSARHILEEILTGKEIGPEEYDILYESGAISHNLKATKEEIIDDLQGMMSDLRRKMMRILLNHLDELNAHISELDDDIDGFMKPEEKQAAEMIREIPGIANTSAQAIISVIGTDMGRFPTDAHISSWAGICPGNNESAKKRRSGKIRVL